MYKLENIINTVINDDCLNVLKDLPDRCIDLVLTDPPYGDGVGYGRFGKEIANNEDETINYKVLPELYRILKMGGVSFIFTNWKFAGKLQDFIETKTEFAIRTMIVVVKNNIGMGYGYRNQHELCWVLEKGEVAYSSADFSNVQRMEHIQHDKDTHPHEKGIDLIGKMIVHTTKPNDLVLDCFLGSGTTAVACKKLNRRFIGIEISPEYCEISRQRLAQGVLPL